MEQDEQALKPQWLIQGAAKGAGVASIFATPSSRQDNQVKGASSRNDSSRRDNSRQSSSRKGSGTNGSRRSDRDAMGKSRGYANFGRNREKNREKDSNSRCGESRAVSADRDGFQSFSTCKPERDRINRAHLKPETMKGAAMNLNNDSTSRRNTDISFSKINDVNINTSERSSPVSTAAAIDAAAVITSPSNVTVTTSASTSTFSTSVKSASNVTLGTSRSNAVVSAPRSNAAGMDFEREFPSLEDKNGRLGISRVPSPGISTPIQNIPPINPRDGWNSVLADLPALSRKSQAASPILQTAISKQTEAMSNSGTALSMAETVIQAPLRISSGPQLSIEAQKIEERTLRQYTLRPLTPPASKSSVLSSSKSKSASRGDPTGLSKNAQQLKLHSANGSVRAPVKIDASKLSQTGSFQILNREQNGTVQMSKDHNNPVRPPAPSVFVEPQKKPVLSQKIKIALQAPCGDKKSNAKDKHIFFESLRTKSSNGTSNLVDVKHDSSLNIGNDQCMADGRCFCEEVNSSEGSQRHLSDNEENNYLSMKTNVADGMPQQLEKGEGDSSSEPPDTADEEFQLSFSDSGAEGSSFSAPVDSDDGFNRSRSGSEEPTSSSDATEPDDDHPAEPPPEDKPFLISLGWREDEVVQPLGLEEIVNSVKGCAELEKKLLSMKSNDNIRIVLHYLGRDISKNNILGGEK